MPQAGINYYGQDEISSGGGVTDSKVQVSPTTEGSGDMGSKAINGGEIQDGSPNGKKEEDSQNEVLKRASKVEDDQKREVIAEYIKAALEENIFAVNSFEIKQKYPKSYNKMLEYMTVRAHGQKIDDDVVAGALMYTPRIVLPDFFDDNEIFVNFVRNANSGHWKYTIQYGKNLYDKTPSGRQKRVPTEAQAYEKAFFILENQLSKP